jgi:hypothetical protein
MLALHPGPIHPHCSSFAKLDADTFSAKDHLVSAVINVATVEKLDTLLLVAPTDKPSKLYEHCPTRRDIFANVPCAHELYVCLPFCSGENAESESQSVSLLAEGARRRLASSLFQNDGLLALLFLLL